MIMEYAEGGELFNYIISKGCLSEDESRNIFQQIIDAIYYLHQIGICHRDLKPENILFDSKDKKRIKIIDFGLSNLYMAGSLSNNNNISFSDRKDLLETPCGSPGYAPPEMILGCKYDGIMTDIWSSGVILYAMLCGCLPFDDFSEDKLYSKIIKGNFVYPPMIEISKEVKNLINSILVVNPKQRFSIDDIKKNKWFLKNYRPSVGLFISICEIPVSNIIIEEMKKRGYDEKKVTEYIKNNNHNSLTTIYYLLVKQKLKQGIETESDLISNVFQEFIKEKNKRNQKENIRPISLKLYIIRSKKNLLKSREEKAKEKEAKKKNNSKNKDNKESETNKENIVNIHKENKSKESKNKESKSKETENNRRENNSKNDKKKKNKTISKEKHQGLNNIQINNIKNIHITNITDIKTNLLVKTCDSNNSKIKLYKKITQLSKNRKEGSNSNSKKKGNKLNTININKMKEGQFRNYMNLQHIKKHTTSSKKKKVKKEKVNRVKNNKTCLGELNSNQINKDFNISMNNNENRNNSIATDNKMLNKGNFLYNGVNINNNDKFIMNYKIKLKKNKNINGDDMGLHKLNLYQIKNGELIKQKNNSRKKFMKEYDIVPKKNNLKLESIPKMSQLLNDFRTSKNGKSRYIISSVSNSQSKSKSRTGGTHTSNSSNSKSKSNSIRDRLQRESFLAFRSSRNNYNKSKSGNKNIENNYTNLTQEKLSNLKNKKIAHTLCRDKNSFLQNKNELNQRNTLNKRCNTKCTNSKSKKKITSKPKNNSNSNYYYKLQNFNTSIGRRHKIKKKIRTKNHIHILINDINNKNIIIRHNTNILENKKLNDNSNSTNIYPDTKPNQSLNSGVIVNQNKCNSIKSHNNISLKKNVKNESFNQNNNLIKMRKSDQIPKDNFPIKQKNENKKAIINNIKKNVKEKMNFHVVNNYNKLKEYNKYSTINNPHSNHDDHHSNDFYNDLANLKISAKNKFNKIINKTKNNKNNEIKKISKKKIQVGDLKSFQIKNFPFYQDVKPQTYRKEKKYLDEPVSSNDYRSKDNNFVHHLANFSNSYN